MMCVDEGSDMADTKAIETAEAIMGSFQDGERRSIGGHSISRYGSRIHVFGNDRNFPLPSGCRLVEAFIGLVNTDREKARMQLPEGRVDVLLPDGGRLAIGDVVPPDVVMGRVETPLAKGCSNWAGPCLVFEAVELPSEEPKT
jgi:hypothetical protein